PSPRRSATPPPRAVRTRPDRRRSRGRPHRSRSRTTAPRAAQAPRRSCGCERSLPPHPRACPRSPPRSPPARPSGSGGRGRRASRVPTSVELDGALDRSDPLAINLAKDAVPAAVVRERRAGGAVRVPELACDRRRREQGLAMRGVADLALRLAQSDQQVAAL